MRATIVCILLAISNLADAVVDPELEEAANKAKSNIVVRFKVIDVQYEQADEVLVSRADVEVLEVIQGELDAVAGTRLLVTWSENYVAIDREAARAEADKRIGGLGPTAVPLLRTGQVATGWFRQGPDGELIPGSGFYSFETESMPEIVEGVPGDEIALNPGQYAMIRDLRLELWIKRFELVGGCPEGMMCVHGGYWSPLMSLVSNGRYAEVQPLKAQPIEVEECGCAITLLKSSSHSQAKFRVVPL